MVEQRRLLEVEMRQLKIECQRVEEFEQFVAAEQVLFFYPGRGFRVLSELGFEFFLAFAILPATSSRPGPDTPPEFRRS